MHKRIVVVEDDDDAREILHLLFEACGAEVFGASNVAEALQVLATVEPDLLISDIGMPVRDGFALMREVRATPALAELPAIALTAFAGEANQARGTEAGFNAYLVKPLDAALLLATAASLVDTPSCD